MKFIGYLILIVLVVVLQVSVMPNLSIGQAFPNLVLIGLLILLFSNLRTPALWWAGLGGLFLDLYSPMHFGIYTIIFLGIYFLIILILEKFISEFSFISILIIFLAASLTIDLVPFFIGSRDWTILLGNAIYTTIVGVIIYYFLTDKLQPRRGEYKIS